MLTLKLKIKNEINVTEWCVNYSYAFHELYKNFELSEDKVFVSDLIKKYNLDSWFYASLKADVSAKKEQKITFDKKNLEQVEELEKELETTKFIGLKGKRRKYKIIKAIQNAKASIGREITFGTRDVLQKISFLSNPISNKVIEGLTKKIAEENDKSKKLKLEEKLKNIESNRLKDLSIYKEKYAENRTLAIYSVGESQQDGNRKFNFDLTNRKVVFKPKVGIKIPIEFYCSKKQQKTLDKIQATLGTIALSTRLDNDYIYISYDEEKLAGMAFDKDKYFSELKKLKKSGDSNEVTRKDCYRKYILEQESRKFFGKNINRYLSVDLNPEYIGFSILERVGERGYKVIYGKVISMTDLNTKLSLSSTDPNQIYQNNKRIYELDIIWKRIFNIARHYKVANFVMEDLDFKSNSINDKSSEANRKILNLWCKTRTVHLINKYCNIIGLKLIPVNPCYSSFIGNIQHNYFDPLSASIEVGRRGITKFLKGGFYPEIERKDLDTMCLLGLDVLNNTVSSWAEAFKLFKNAELRYRHELKDHVENNLSSCRSGVKIYHFNTI